MSNGRDPNRAGPEPSVGEQLGLGPLFSPSPASFRLHKLRADDGETHHVLAFDTVAGSFGVVLTDEGLGHLIRAAQQNHTGLTLPNNFPRGG